MSDHAQSTQKKLPPPPLSTLFPPIPSIASFQNPSSPPPFGCILLLPALPSAIDFLKLLVTLKTCTATHRTTFGTLTSRLSRLASYLKSLFSDVDEELDPEGDSMSSQAENGSFNSWLDRPPPSRRLVAITPDTLNRLTISNTSIIGSRSPSSRDPVGRRPQCCRSTVSCDVCRQIGVSLSEIPTSSC